jgi:DoxX-like family
MDVAFWIVASLLALLYLYSGGLKVVRSREQLQPMMEWVDTAPMAGVRAVGAVELVGAVGLILPAATGIAPWLAFAAAAGFVVLQAGAIPVHLRRGDRQIGLNVGLLVAAGVAAWLATGRM